VYRSAPAERGIDTVGRTIASAARGGFAVANSTAILSAGDGLSNCPLLGIVSVDGCHGRRDAICLGHRMSSTPSLRCPVLRVVS
jgi:hypothetical protein